MRLRHWSNQLGRRPIARRLVLGFAALALWYGAVRLSLTFAYWFGPFWGQLPNFCREQGELLWATLFGAGAASLTFLYIGWDQLVTEWRRSLWLFVPFAVMMGFSASNFAFCDQIITRPIQALFNLVLVFCGLSVAITLYRIRPASVSGLVLRGMAIALLMLCTVVIPTTWSALWLLNRVGGGVVDWDVIKTAATVVSAIVALLSFLQKRREAEPTKLQSTNFSR